MNSRNRINECSHSSIPLSSQLRKLWTNLTATIKSSESHTLLAPVEELEDRFLLSAILPVWVDGHFSFGDPNSDAPYGLENTFKLSSNPTATKTIFLDFDGHHSVNNSWGHDIMFDPFDTDGDPGNFSDAELIEMQKQFQNVAEDFFPFQVNVTTIDPGEQALMNTGGNDIRWGIRSLATQAKDGFGNGIGGVAMIGSFNWDEDTPAFSFNKGVNNGGMTQSHEVGHTLFLQHDGLNSQQYHPGTGTGETGWGPIMGAPFGQNVVHWSKGEYAGSTNNQDDLAVITTENGFGFKPDDHGNNITSASELTIENDVEASGWGFIGKTSDVDYFRFSTGDGNIKFTISPFQEHPNLDVEARIFDSNGSLVATSNPINGVGANFDLNVDAGDYFISIDGVGKAGVYTEYGSLGFYSIVGDIQVAGGGAEYLIGESDNIQINNVWTTVVLNGIYVDPVIVATVTTANEADPVTIRIRNVESDSFQIQLDEWDYQNGIHAFETVNYLVMESGIHVLDNGMRVFAGNISTNHNWTGVTFNGSAADGPVVVAQTITRNGGAAVVTRLDNVTNDGFDVKLQEEEAADGTHAYETVSWIAFDGGVGEYTDIEYDADSVDGVRHFGKQVNFNRVFDSSPAVLAAMQTYNGSNTSYARAGIVSETGVILSIQEEQSKDSEVGHINETVGYVAIEIGDIFGSTSIGEAGRVTNLTHQWQTITLIQTFENPVVIAGLISLNDTDEAVVRVRNVTSNSFQIQVDEWNFSNGSHAGETVGYFVVEAGVHKLPDGTIIVANNAETNHNWKGVDYGYDFDEAPVVISQVSTNIGRATVTTRMDDVTENGFDLRLQEEEGADGTHSRETIGWVAVEVGAGNAFGFGHQSTLFDGLTDEAERITFISGVFSRTPVVFGGVQTFNDGDTVAIREADTPATDKRAFVFLQEERSADPEQVHGPELAGIFALDRGKTPGTTLEFFSGPSTGASPPSFAMMRMAVVPRITYVDNGPVIAETALPFAEAHDLGIIGLQHIPGFFAAGSQVSDLAFALNGEIGDVSFDDVELAAEPVLATNHSTEIKTDSANRISFSDDGELRLEKLNQFRTIETEVNSNLDKSLNEIKIELQSI